MNFIPTFTPATGNRTSTLSVRDTDGKVYTPIVCPQVTQAQALSFQSGNNSSVAKAAIGNTVQPSTAQLTGLLAYLAAIQAGTNTSSVETAIGAL